MLANSLFRKKCTSNGAFFRLDNNLKINNMKMLRYLLFTLSLTLASSQIFAQYISVKPDTICFGTLVTVTITPPVPAGKTVGYFKFYFGTYEAVNVSPTNNSYTFPLFVCQPGTYTLHGYARTTDSATFPAIPTGNLTITIYNLPKADFSLSPLTKDTQCLNGNSYVFVNKSTTGPSPSNPLKSFFWDFGDLGSVSTTTPSDVSHQYLLSRQYNVRLVVTDQMGCKGSVQNPPGSSTQNGVTVVGNLPPNFKWVGTPNCFKSCYKFTNLSTTAAGKVQFYKWDFGDGTDNLCPSINEADSNYYTAIGPLTSKYLTTTDSITNRFDSLHYDTITHCYCKGGQFKPMLVIGNDYGCIDSTRKTPQTSGTSGSLPFNTSFKFDVQATKAFPKDTIAGDSVCAQSGSGSSICYKQTPIDGMQPGSGDFVWDFGDPADPTNRNLDSNTWNPCHAYSSMGSFFPSVKVKCPSFDTTFFYYAATMVGPYRRMIDTMYDDQRDLIDGTISYSRLPVDQIVNYKGAPAPAPAFDGQALLTDVLDSVQMKYLRTEVRNGTTYYIYTMIFRNKYFGDPIYVLRDINDIYDFMDTVPPPNMFAGKPYQTIRDSLTNRIRYVFSVLDKNGNPKDTIWYAFTRSYRYGVRVLGPAAKIEDPPKKILIAALQKNQCGPRDTVDFVNASATGFKARSIWRRWDFGDVYAPQCTSFSRPLPGFELLPTTIVKRTINEYRYYQPLPNQDNATLPPSGQQFKDTMIILRDTVRMWVDALGQWRNSEHWFINNGQIYPGKRNCNFSHDTLPRHHYPNWDTVYLWYRYGHDFMPWNPAGGPGGPPQFTQNIAQVNPPLGVSMVKQWDNPLWGQAVYLNIGTGEESIAQLQTKMFHHIVWIPKMDSITMTVRSVPVIVDDPNGVMVDWPRIDTLNSGLPHPAQLPRDLQPGNAPLGLLASLVPDPFQMALGGYYLINGVFIDTLQRPGAAPQLSYSDKGKTFLLPGGTTMLPSSQEDFFEYVFRRTIQKCITVKLRLTDSLNNETADPGFKYDITRLDMWDCTSEATVQLILGKPDARGMGKKGKECPGLNPPGYPALVLDNSAPGFPGTVLNCGGQTAIWVDMDSLADRMDGTPCYLDGFTTWGVGTPGTKINPGPGTNTTPGGLVRNTFYTGMNWNPNPPSPWTGPGGTLIQYHMGGNAGTPPAADTLQGFVTICLYIGNGQKDTTFYVYQSDYYLNRDTFGGPLKDIYGRFGSPTYTYKTLPVIRQIVNKATPPPVPIPNGWIDDSLYMNFTFSSIVQRTPKLRLKFGVWVQDTLLQLEYLDANYPNCLSDTVCYHNFWHIKELDPTFTKSPLELAQLRERLDTMWVIYRDSVQDSVLNTVWTWGDGTATIDSFYYSGKDTSDGYYTHGVRRVRYNIDFTYGYPGQLLDSTVWPCGVYGKRQFSEPVRFYKRGFDSIGFIGPDILVLRDKCPVPAHNGYGIYPDTIKLRAKDTTNIFFQPSYRRVFNKIATIAPDTFVLVNKCPNPSHYDPKWFPYTNYFDTLFLRIKDTMQFTQFRTIDTSLMILPIFHVYQKTSWEMAGRSPGSIITQISSFIQNTQNCQYTLGDLVTVGVADTLHIYDQNGLEDTVFCKNEPIFFVDSVRYYRYDNQLTNVPLGIFGTSRPTGYHGFGSSYGNTPPWCSLTYDTVDFWARDAKNPADTVINNTSILSASMIEFKYFPGEWTNYDFNMATGAITYTPGLVPPAPLTGHWAPVLRGGKVQVVLPTAVNDPADVNPYPGMVIFSPTTGPLGFPGIYVWGAFGGWQPSFSPIVTVDSLRSYTDLTAVPIPTIGKTLIFNNGKGAIKQVGMYYWSGSQWVFICNSPYSTFPYYTHRLYWDFGDGSPIYVGVRPVHRYNGYGRYTVTMASRDSTGNFDTCISHVEVMKPVAKPWLSKHVIGCNDTAFFWDSSYVLCGVDTNSMDQEVARYWWLNLKFKYPFGLQGQDTLTPQSALPGGVWFYSSKGIYKIKLAIETVQGCRDTAVDSISVAGPRPAFKLITDTIGCNPYYQVCIKNMADSFDMRNSADTPTRSTIFYWGDGQQTAVTGRRDIICHHYAASGMYSIFASGSDALPNQPNACPIVNTPDTANGFQKPINIYVKDPYRVKITASSDTLCVNQQITITNTSDSLNYKTYKWIRTYGDSLYTQIDTRSMSDTGVGSGNNTGPYLNTFDSVGNYRIILIPTGYQNSVSLLARCPLADTVKVVVFKPKSLFSILDLAPTYNFTNTSTGSDYYDWVVYDKNDTTKVRATTYPGHVFEFNKHYTYNLGDDTGRFKVCLYAYKYIPKGQLEWCQDKYCDYITNNFLTRIKIYNVFTPGRDGYNDVFKIDIEGEQKYELTIFNRWGTKVFYSTDKNNMWNGKDNNDGAECANGTYFYVFNYRLRGQNDATQHGTVTLIREQ